MTRPLNPYDTGERLEPKPWVELDLRDWMVTSLDPRPADPDDFGRVDFDDDEGATIAVIHMEKRTLPDGSEEYVVVIDEVQDIIPIRVEGPQ